MDSSRHLTGLFLGECGNVVASSLRGLPSSGPNSPCSVAESGTTDAQACGSGDETLVSALSPGTISISNTHSPSMLSSFNDDSDGEDELDELDEDDYVGKPLQVVEVRGCLRSCFDFPH